MDRNANRRRKSWISNHLLTPVGFTPIVSVDFIGPQWSMVVFRGNCPAKIDEKGRLKIPADFRAALQDRYGAEVYVTSRKAKGVVVNIYPMPVWEEMERKLSLVPRSLPELARYADLVNYYGQPGEIDKQGRVSIHPLLRESAAMTGDVDVLGQFDHLDVWNHDRFAKHMADEPFTDADLRKLAEFGI